jgi:hypothetical protein
MKPLRNPLLAGVSCAALMVSYTAPALSAPAVSPLAKPFFVAKMPMIAPSAVHAQPSVTPALGNRGRVSSPGNVPGTGLAPGVVPFGSAYAPGSGGNGIATRRGASAPGSIATAHVPALAGSGRAERGQSTPGSIATAHAPALAGSGAGRAQRKRAAIEHELEHICPRVPVSVDGASAEADPCPSESWVSAKRDPDR